MESKVLDAQDAPGLGAGALFEPRKQRAYIADYFFWTRGEESAAWLGIHEAEELLCRYSQLRPSARVCRQHRQSSGRSIARPRMR